MPDTVFALNQSLRDRLINLIQDRAPAEPPAVAVPAAELRVVHTPGSAYDSSAPLHVVVSINEINDCHGTGPLVKRIYRGRANVFSIRSRNDWGIHDFGDWNVCIPQQGRSRAECFQRVLSVLRGRQVETVLCVPFLADELLTAIAVKESFGARMCAYVMDDQNVATNRLPDKLVREFLEKCSFRVVTHPELRYAYERKYGLKFYLLPAVVPHHLVSTQAVPPATAGEGRCGALIGSFWDQSWFDRLCDVLAGSGWQIDWFGNNRSPWLKFSAERMERAGIVARGVVPEEELAAELRKYPFVIVPAGALDAREKNAGVAWLSLPGRILFAVSTSHTPVLLVGSPRTCGARFVSQFGVGEVVPYERGAISDAIERLVRPDTQRQMRERAAFIARGFWDRGVSEWLAESIRLGAPADNRFEDAFASYDPVIDIPGLADGPRLEAAGA